MNIEQLREHFLSRSPWVDRETTCDRIHVGEGQTPLRKVATGWTACEANLRAAANDGCDLFISHELPWPANTFSAEQPPAQWARLRQALCMQAGLGLMNLHDTWDHWPTFGVRDSWAGFLHLGEQLKVLDYIHPGHSAPTTGRESLAIHRVPATTVGKFARQLAQRIGEVRMDSVTVMGDPAAAVQTVAIGVGCHVPGFECLTAGADLLIVTYDRSHHTRDRICLVEMGANLIVLEHGASEMPAMANLARYINQTFDDLTATFYCHEPVSQTYTAAT